MTAPREVLPGRTYLITRRCTQRQFLLRPSRRTNQIVWYCLGIAAAQTGMQLHAVCFMSNHWHGVVSDPSARLPEFLERFHRLVARAQNAALGRWENFWSSEKTSVVHLVSDQDIVEKMAYTMSNPTAAGLVRSPHEWPGVITRRIGEHRVADMPDIFFDPSGTLPPVVAMDMVRPPIAHIDDRELSLRLAAAVERLVRTARAAIVARGERFLGVPTILRQAVSAVPKTKENWRALSPRLATRNKALRIATLQGLAAFRRLYRHALVAWRGGARDAVFPAGTYALRIYARVACAPACPL